ncbi:uncharacterized protein DNG_09297 [Cephalotrichum gorgonifer]|uniref:Zn(2)-C6 fungal-type domain-containing protein n=1 Tax=Cephalotrichum gorgonifer TaxID=2041049 RepID=A0AAE8N5J4_9PEZI|nr:uncharacterized protein DNG_09297 [Cephalotrichum gorgonifer]
MPPPRGPRMPACEPCRQSKLSCDHARPSCARCAAGQKAASCVYRMRPFSRKRHINREPPRMHSDQVEPPTPETPTASPVASTPRTSYPNPLYLGASSHVTIFNHLSQDENPLQVSNPPSESAAPPGSEPFLGFEGEMQAAKIAEGLRRLLGAFPGTFPLNPLRDLIAFWRATGANLALCEPFVDLIVHDPLDDLLSLSLSSRSSGGADQYLAYARSLLHNSSRPLSCQPSLTVREYASQFLGSNTRLETVGLLFCAVIRAASEVHIFPALYLEDARRQELLALAVKLTNVAVEVCLSFDRLNDLQLVFQYENFISHSYVFGVQSYHSYRKLGDVITSIVSLGYHEKTVTSSDVPAFLVIMRRTAFARAYSADKNWAIFLGRPPRLGKKFCHLQAALSQTAAPDEKSLPVPERRMHVLTWHPDSEMDIWAETRWTAICASLKEEILEMFNGGSRDNFNHRVNHIRQQAEDQWMALPRGFRMEGSLKDYPGGGLFERDFLVSTRLNYLHVLFLLRLLCLGSPADPDATFVSLAREILSLVVEVIVLRGQLVCSSGTSFEWKLCHYGLPAIGIIMISMLRRNNPTDGFQESKTLRDLGIIVSGVDLGTIVRPTEPNYALLSRATNTINKFLERIHLRDRRLSPPTAASRGAEPAAAPEMAVAASVVEPWIRQSQLEPWDFEAEFWDNLAEHPSMFNPFFPVAE